MFDKCYGKFLDLDMFGEQINFNIQGRSHYDTCCGVLCTAAVLFLTVLFGYLSAIRAMTEHEIPHIQRQIKEEYFEAGRDVFQVRQDSETSPFSFAIAVTSHVGYKTSVLSAATKKAETEAAFAALAIAEAESELSGRPMPEID